VISDELAKNTKTDVIEPVQLIIPPEVKIINIETEKNKHVNNGDTLVEFTYENSVEDYLETTQIDTGEDIEAIDMYSTGDKTLKLLAPEGDIIDIKVFINNKNSVDKQLLNFHNNLVKEQENIINKLQSSIKDPSKKVQATDNMDLSFMNFGNHKYKGNLFNGARVVYYIRRQKDLKIGDKISNRYGSKGVISKILTQAPRGEISPKIDIFLSPLGVFSRKNVSMLKELYLGKIFYFANIRLKEMADDSKITVDTIVKFITDIYSILGLTKLVASVEQVLKQYNLAQLRKNIKEDNIRLICMIEPFQDVNYKSIKSAADFLDIPLEEKVYIPEFDQWTDTPVPVGVSYFVFLEHYSDDFANIRGTGRFVGLTRQPTKRKSQEGGQAIGRLDIYAFLTYDAKNILTELLGPRSDEHRAKRDLYNNIIETGDLQTIQQISKTGGTRDIFNLYITGLGLEIV
jgi:DNA-directed RNA polymerase beta subunit